MEDEESYLDKFLDEITNFDNTEKMAQIGIEPSVLGIPKENVTFSKARSYFVDVPFNTQETTKVPKQWLDFTNLQSPLKIISVVPDLTLFFMFYTQPHDLIQVSASEELQNRGWNYNETYGKWTCENETDTYEFDLHSWCIKKCKQNQQNEN